MEKMEKLLSQIFNVFSTKEYFKLKYQFKTTDFTSRFDIPIKLNENLNYVMYMKRIAVYNTIFNVDATNKIFTYSPTGTAPWKTITITPGAYEIKQINTIIQTQMKTNGDWNSTASTYYISLAADEPTSKTIMTISSPYKVDFTIANSINSLLGFNPAVYSAGTNTSQNLILITLTNDVDVYCDWVNSNSYVNSKLSLILYSFSAYSVKVGAKIIVSEINPIYLPLTKKYLDSINIKLIDDNGKLLNFNGETVIIEIIVQQV